ncbi:hypothetical protein [Paenibacillus sp. IHBB 10380]|uniref:hypothetical protein n=1 Tax=Paenibacillus sp. IHBB 10380 TaxID=1566358 RepID=UPI000A613284|nr:hypothetical protein [Paenibacillus sp. IHBB 10380]
MKSVEMQIAMPRTHEAGKIQNEFLQRPVQDQVQLAAQSIKESREMSQRSTEVDETAHSSIREEGKQHSSQKDGLSRTQEQEQQEQVTEQHLAEHPYKGHRIDLSL